MDEALWHKFTQHKDLREELLSTGEAELVEVRYLIYISCSVLSYYALPGLG
jgi:predicted NAD-dependent protein-ADP-ribosyltransferase YbiA (DUF1768 family)